MRYLKSGILLDGIEQTNNRMLNALIIDDDPIQIRIAELLLKRSGLFSYICYSNADTALDFLIINRHNASKLPDVIFIDLHMPHLDGWGFLNTYRDMLPGLCKNINVFIVTSSIDSRDHQRSCEYAFVKGFISKPITNENLNEIFYQVTEAG